MPHEPDERIADDTRVPTDSGLRCPQCDYNLTGLTEKRCPECGSAFDPEELREILAGRPGPIPGWDDRYRSTWIVGLARACRLMWFRPTEFAQRFPWTFDPQSVASFWILSRAVAVVVSAIGPAVAASVTAGSWPRGGFEVMPILLTLWCAFVGSLACEGLVVIVLRIFVRPKYVPRVRSSALASTSWWGYVGMHSSFLVLIAATLGTLLGLLVAASANAGRGALLLWAMAIGDTVWWWSCLGIGIWNRTTPGAGRGVAIALVPFLAIASVFIGVMAGYVCLAGVLR